MSIRNEEQVMIFENNVAGGRAPLSVADALATSPQSNRVGYAIPDMHDGPVAV